MPVITHRAPDGLSICTPLVCHPVAYTGREHKTKNEHTAQAKRQRENWFRAVADGGISILLRLLENLDEHTWREQRCFRKTFRLLDFSFKATQDLIWRVDGRASRLNSNRKK